MATVLRVSKCVKNGEGAENSEKPGNSNNMEEKSENGPNMHIALKKIILCK